MALGSKSKQKANRHITLLRYPGGKSKALKQILPHVPSEIGEFREPLVGGGSVFLAIKYRFGSRISKYWINDLNYDLYCFWKYVRDDVTALLNDVRAFKRHYSEGEKLYSFLKYSVTNLSERERAVRFFIMNRIAFSGMVDAGGYSQESFEKRFTDSSIDRIERTAAYLSKVEITNLDYADVIHQDGDNVFIFLDPPYLSATDSRLYGVRGNLHTSFDHERFADEMRKCKHRWLITYDDSEAIRSLFSFANIVEWDLQYGMNNYKQETAARGRELFIKNY
jgi:DNA adenine methylase